jgi:hypothetical protein
VLVVSYYEEIGFWDNRIPAIEEKEEEPRETLDLFHSEKLNKLHYNGKVFDPDRT